MIRLVENDEDKELLFNLCSHAAFGCKIASVAQNYGFDKSFACFWIDSENEAVFALEDDVMLIAGYVRDEAEAESFLRTVGVKKVFCAVRNSGFLNMPKLEGGDVLCKMASDCSDNLPEESVSIREIYNLLEETGSELNFEAFYLDLSHKLRHGTAYTAGEYIDDTLAGCAVVSGSNGSGAVLSAVAVREENRRKGIGSRLVKKVENRFAGKEIYVFKEKGKNEEFYSSLDFRKTDSWIMCGS